MTSQQMELGEERGVAEELAAGQRSISIAEFFERNKHMLGFDSDARAIVTAVKEGVDNSLTHDTPFVYRTDGETIHAPIGDAIDGLIESNPEDVIEKRGGDLEKLRVDGMEALSFDEGYDVDFQRVSSVFRHRVNSDIYRITVEGGREVELTDYHSVFVLRDGEVVSVETSEIGEDDYVVLPDTEWGGGARRQIDLVEELLELPPERTEDVGLYGVEHLIEAHYDDIREYARAQYRMSDFRKCDRLPLNVLRELDLDSEAYEDCEIGYRYGSNDVPAVLPVDESLAELLGLYVAEGCVTGENGGHEKVYLSLGSHETELIAHAERLVSEVFGLDPSTVDAHETATNVTIPAKTVGLLFEEVFDAGTGAREKRLPRWLLDFPAPLRERFALGFAAGDGYPTASVIDVLLNGGDLEDVEEYRVTLATSSDRLSSGLRYLLSSIGYDTTHERIEPETRPIEGREAEFGTSNLLHVRTDQSGVSAKRLPASEAVSSVQDPKLAYNLDGRQERVETEHALALADGGGLEFAGNGRAIAEGDLTALPVTDVERIEYDGEWVYDVSVPGDENFMAGTAPLACHNSLDAAEEAGILPDVYVDIEDRGDYYRLVIEDNGPGIPADNVPDVYGKMLYGSRFHSREQSLLPDQQMLVRRDGEVGLVEIGTLCDAYIPDREGARTVPIPDDVEAPCFDRETGEIAWRDITHAIRHETDHDAYRIETSRGRSIEVTGNHSLFTLGPNGEPEEVEAAELQPGDHVLAPERIPAPDDRESVNLLEWIPRSELDERDWFVYGIDESLIDEIVERGERVRKLPSPDSTRERTYYRFDGVDVLKDSIDTNYRPKGYLPADVVVDLGWEDRVADGVVRTYQVGGEPDEVPVTVPLSSEFARFLGLYVAEGHADTRQVGFTLGSHETELVSAVEGTAASVFDAGTTTVERERNSVRVKAFGSPLAVFLREVCGQGSREKHVPPFLFRASPTIQQAFLDGLYEGDGSDAHPSNQLSFATTSERLAREVSYLWSMRGVVASWKERTNESNITGGRTEMYDVLVYGEDIERSDRFDVDAERTARYRRLPASLLEELREEPASVETVPATRAGVFRAAGLGSSREYAEEFLARVERLLDGENIPGDNYRQTLEERSYVTPGGEPTERLEELWRRTERLVAFADSDLALVRVENVEGIDAPEYVYDVSVPGTGADENFVAGNQGALCVKNSRGQQGIGISAAVLYAQLTSGKPAKITSKPKGGTATYFELTVDTDANEPEVEVQRDTTWEPPHGTKIELELEANMRARRQLHAYVRQTAVVNPHARIEFVEPEAHMKFERATDQLPAETEEIRPHPHGVELGTLIKMLEATESYSVSGFLQGEFTRVGKKTADKLVRAFKDRHYGRELSWTPPAAHDGVDVRSRVADAVANKGAAATERFVDYVLEGGDGFEGLADRERVSRSELDALVAAAADATEADTDRTFGDTVREKAAAAAWRAIVGGDGDDSEAGAVDRLAPDLYALVDDATTSRKDDAAVEAMARRIATRIVESGPRHRRTRAELEEHVAWAAERTAEREDESFGETARGKVVDALWGIAPTVPDDPPKVRAVAGDRDTASELLEAMRETNILSPPTDCLAPITEELVEEGLRKEYDADFFAAATRDAEVHGGDPFIAEAGIAYGGDLPDDGEVDLLRFANRVPLVYQRGACATADVVTSINWRNYGLDQPGGTGMPGGPAVIMVHVASTNVPFTSESKDAVANVPEIEDEIELALREAARELKSYLNKQRSLEKRRRKENVIADILPRMATKLEEVTGRERLDIEDSLARIMNNVLVERERDGEEVRLVVTNHSDRTADLEVTDIVTAEPGDPAGDGADPTVVEMDGEWFVKWAPSVPSGDRAVLTYSASDASFDVSVDGVEPEKLTVDA